MPENAKKSGLTQEEQDKIIDAAIKVMGEAMKLVDNNPLFAIKAMCLSVGTSAACAKIGYEDLIQDVSLAYEDRLKAEFDEQIADFYLPLFNGLKPSGVQ